MTFYSPLNTLQQGSLYNQPKQGTMRGISLKITIDFTTLVMSSWCFSPRSWWFWPHLWAKWTPCFSTSWDSRPFNGGIFTKVPTVCWESSPLSSMFFKVFEIFERLCFFWVNNMVLSHHVSSKWEGGSFCLCKSWFKKIIKGLEKKQNYKYQCKKLIKDLWQSRVSDMFLHVISKCHSLSCLIHGAKAWAGH